MTNIKDLNVLYYVLVYNKVGQLRFQEDVVRSFYGDNVKIGVYANGSEDPSWKEDYLAHSSHNPGPHFGVADGVNSLIRLSRTKAPFDFTVLTEADCVFSDPHVIPTIVSQMRDSGKKLGVLYGRKGKNTHDGDRECDAIVTLWFASREGLSKMREVKIRDAGIEIAFGEMVKETFSDDEIMVVPCKYMGKTAEEQPHHQVKNYGNDDFFEDVAVPGSRIYRDVRFPLSQEIRGVLEKFQR